MWARVVEFMLGCWLAVSPFVFQHADQAVLSAIDYAAATAVITFALLSYWPPARWAHLGTLAVATGLIVVGRASAWSDLAPGYQNHIVVGLLLLMFAIVPNDASQPPRSWYQQERA